MKRMRSNRPLLNARLRALFFGALLFGTGCPPPASGDAGPLDAGPSGHDAGATGNPPSDAGPIDASAPLCQAPDGGPPDLPDFPDGEPGAAFRHVEGEDGRVFTRVNAASSTYVLLDLETRAQVTADDRTTSTAWDLAFFRFHIAANSGASGPGSVEIAPLEGVAFDDVVEAPADGYLADLPDEDLDGQNEHVICEQHGWWCYSLSTHVLYPLGTVYVVKTHEGSYFKLEVLHYYSEGGEAGHPTFVWKALPPPGGTVEDAGPDDAGTDAGDGDGGA